MPKLLVFSYDKIFIISCGNELICPIFQVAAQRELDTCTWDTSVYK